MTPTARLLPLMLLMLAACGPAEIRAQSGDYAGSTVNAPYGMDGTLEVRLEQGEGTLKLKSGETVALKLRPAPRSEWIRTACDDGSPVEFEPYYVSPDPLRFESTSLTLEQIRLVPGCVSNGVAIQALWDQSHVAFGFYRQ